MKLSLIEVLLCSVPLILNVTYIVSLLCCCHYADCRYAECRGANALAYNGAVLIVTVRVFLLYTLLYSNNKTFLPFVIALQSKLERWSLAILFWLVLECTYFALL
jgi:hypothetical protein